MKVRGWSSFAFYSGMETVLLVPVREARRPEIRRRRPVRLPLLGTLVTQTVASCAKPALFAMQTGEAPIFAPHALVSRS